MSRRMAARFLTGLLIAAVVAGGVLWVRRETPSVVPQPKPIRPADPREGDYVASETCAKCHGAIAAAYRSHPMALSVQPVERVHSGSVGEVARFADDEGCEYLVTADETGVRHHERIVTADGTTLYDQAIPVHFAIGSGSRGRSFVMARDGLLFLSPVSWYTQGERWDFSPGHAQHARSRFERRVEARCLFCHAGRAMPIDRDAGDRFRNPPVQELSIGCERCHGPGREHVALYESDQAATAHDPLIVNPAKLDPQRRDHVCAQCHLAGSLVVLRHDKQFHDFRPGQLLDDVWTVLVTGETVSRNTTRAVSQVEQLRSSQCFLRSGGRLGCTACHDPHRALEPDQKEERYRSRCLACHGDRGCSLPAAEREAAPKGNACTACHMPGLNTQEIAHTALTDHRILRRPDAVAEWPADRTTNALQLFDGAEQRLPEWEAKRARGLGLLKLATESSAPQHVLNDARGLLLQTLKHAPDDVAVLLALSKIEFRSQNLAQARRHLETALQLAPRHEETLTLFALLCYQTGDYQAGLQALDRLFAIDPWHADLYGRQAQMRAVFGDLTAAIKAAERGIELSPGLIELRTALADFLGREGRMEESRRQRDLIEFIERRRQSAAANR